MSLVLSFVHLTHRAGSSVHPEVVHTPLFRNLYIINSCCIPLYSLILHNTNCRELQMFVVFYQSYEKDQMTTQTVECEICRHDLEN